ncbi:MAG: aspartate aminotransferase family protein [Deltaproteobacteria bacterium]|nr:aspartate aminotransferase family protein [Deltaproteobacteria bacterium]
MDNDVISGSRRLLTPALVFHTGIVAVKAEGLYVEDASGKRYMDFTSGLATSNLGHCPPEVVAAAKAQLENLIHSGCIFHYRSEVELAERLARITPEGIEMFFFSNSGAEAVEGAVKLARHSTGRQGIIAFTGAFHGRTLGALSLTSSSSRYRRNYHPLLPSVFHAPYPYCYRCPMGKKSGECSLECFGFLEKMLKHQISAEEVACAVIEPVLGEGGYVVPPAEYLKRIEGLCRANGILLVADEVQTGFGRTGRWFACEHFGLTPDIIALGKAIASGFPLSAVGSTAKIMSGWPPGAHGTTFGGNPVSCAAACAAIDRTERESILGNAAEMGLYAVERLRAMQGKCSSIGDVRGLGLMLGVEFVKKDGSPDREFLKKVMDGCLSRGLIVIECGPDKNVVRLMPPLTATKTEMERALDIFEEALC